MNCAVQVYSLFFSFLSLLKTEYMGVIVNIVCVQVYGLSFSFLSLLKTEYMGVIVNIVVYRCTVCSSPPSPSFRLSTWV